jgi:hypothetical protein
MNEIPDIAKEGKLIDPANPQPEVRKNAELAKDWEYSEEATYLYRMAVVFKNRFLDPIILTDRRRLPDPVISFANLRNWNTLATYTLVRNPQGLLFEITMNTEHYEAEDQDGKKKKVWSFGKWAQLETLLHEQVHLWQQNFGEDPVKPGRPYHNREFVLKCESLGLHPMLGAGCHTRLADGPFEILMKELGIERPADVPSATEWTKAGGIRTDWFKAGKESKGTSTLHKWTCPECGLNARFGIKGNPEIIHEPCSQKKGEKVFFVRADGLSHTIFQPGYDFPHSPRRNGEELDKPISS